MNLSFKLLRPYLLLFFFILLLVLGIYLEEYRAVLDKAVKICLSCIGIE